MGEKVIISNEIKTMNRQLIYRFIRDEGSVSKQDIVVDLQLSLPTVTQNLQYLEELGLVDTSKMFKNTGGRNAKAYTYVKGAKMSIGVYMSANHINVVAVDLSGNVVKRIRHRIRFNLHDETYLQMLGELVEQIKEQTQIADSNFLGVGIAVPGLISEDGEEVIYGLTLNFTGQTRAHIAKYISYPNRLVHDSFAAGYAEAWIDKRISNAFHINLNNNVGGSFVVDKTIYPGDTHKGGEIGHMTVRHEGGKKCYCGQYGCLDTVCSTEVLEQYTGGDLEEFFNLLASGDEGAGQLWSLYLDDLALAIHNIRMLFDSIIIIGGYVGAYIEDYIDELTARVDARSPFGDKAADYLIPCKYKVEATAAGAAILYIDEYIDSI